MLSDALVFPSRSGLQVGAAGNTATAATIAAIACKVWQSHEKVEDSGTSSTFRHRPLLSHDPRTSHQDCVPH